jgi:integrase
MSKKKGYPIPGSMRKRKTGNSFEFRFRVPKDDGTGTRQVSVYGATEKDCIAKAREVLARIEAEMPARDSSESFAALVSLWERTWLPNQDRRQSTIDQYGTLIQVHALPVIGDMRMKAVKPSHLRELLANVDRSASTRRSLYAALKDVFACAVTDGLLGTNPMLQVKRPTNAYREPRELTPEQVTAVLNETEGHPWRTVMLVMATTGIRRGEALGLTWQDIDLQAGVLHIRQQVTRTSKGLGFTPPKSRSGIRTVPLSAPIVAELRAHSTRQKQARLRVGELWKDLDLITTTDLGGMVEPRNFSRWYAKCASNAGLPDLGFHALRHYFVTAAIHEGNSAVDVAKVVGHSSPAFTLNQYANAVEEGQKRSAAAVARSLGLGS